MKDRLKEFVNENREDFDVFEPRPELWQEICSDLKAQATPEKAPRKEAKVISINFGERLNFSADFLLMRVAATIILLLACGATLWMVKQNTPAPNNMVAAANERSQLNQIAPELAEVEVYYASQIESKREELSAYDLKVLGLDETREIDRELARLDSSYTQLKTQLYTTPNTDQVMSAMIQNLQIRIEVLNRQLEVLQKIEQLQKQDNTEPNDNETTTI
jgi:septal ring factor EnvC (AmiA/AmiB activator)